jgi:hypothetical protein
MSEWRCQYTPAGIANTAFRFTGRKTQLQPVGVVLLSLWFLRLRAHRRRIIITWEDNAARRAEFPATLQKPPSYKAFGRLGFSRAGNRQAPPATRERAQIMPARRP